MLGAIHKGRLQIVTMDGSLNFALHLQNPFLVICNLEITKKHKIILSKSCHTHQSLAGQHGPEHILRNIRWGGQVVKFPQQLDDPVMKVREISGQVAPQASHYVSEVRCLGLDVP